MTMIIGSKTFSPDQLDKTLQELAQFLQKIPVLPDEAFSSREQRP